MSATPPVASSVAVRERMSAQRTSETAQELLLRRALHRNGLRYRVGYRVPDLPRRTIDVAFPRWKLAVFVDGCFWHVCPEHATWPRANGEWWRAKLERNHERDRDTDEALKDQGWTVLRFWEHEDMHEAAVRVLEELGQRASR